MQHNEKRITLALVINFIVLATAIGFSVYFALSVKDGERGATGKSAYVDVFLTGNAVFEVQPSAIFQEGERMHADLASVRHGDRDFFLFRVDVYEIEGNERFTIIELKFA